MMQMLSLEFPCVINRSEDKQMYVVLRKEWKIFSKIWIPKWRSIRGQTAQLFSLVHSTFTIEQHLQITVAFDVEILRNPLFFPSGNGPSSKRC